MDHSAIQWIQIPAKKLTRAVTFYKNVFKAAFFFEDLNEIPHAVFKVNESGKKLMHGTIAEMKDYENKGKGPVLFFNATGDFETIVELIKENEGKIIRQKTLIVKKESDNNYTIPNTYIDNKPGYYVHFLDSEGNKMGLYGTN